MTRRVDNAAVLARVRNTLAEVAATTGVVAPTPKLRRQRGALHVARSLRHGVVLGISADLVMSASDQALRGMLAHEMQHVRHQDLRRPPWWSIVVVIVVDVLVLFAVTALVLAMSFELPWVSLAAALVGALLVTIIVARTIGRLSQRHWSGELQPVIELRNDLAAARLLGREPVLSGLEWLAAYEENNLGASPGQAATWLLRLASVFAPIEETHPPTADRIRAVENDARDLPPLQAARHFLGDPAALRGLSAWI